MAGAGAACIGGLSSVQSGGRETFVLAVVVVVLFHVHCVAVCHCVAVRSRQNVIGRSRGKLLRKGVFQIDVEQAPISLHDAISTPTATHSPARKRRTFLLLNMATTFSAPSRARNVISAITVGW